MFDPYHKWLGIAPKDQPPNHYRLLGIELFESDLDVIEGGADQKMAFVRQYQAGEHAALAAKILNELAMARLCLLMPATKAAYDAKLRQQLVPLEAEFPELPFSVDEPLPQRRTRKSAKPKATGPSQSLLIGGGIAAVFVVIVAMLLVSGRRKTPGNIATHPDSAVASPAKTIVQPGPDLKHASESAASKNAVAIRPGSPEPIPFPLQTAKLGEWADLLEWTEGMNWSGRGPNWNDRLEGMPKRDGIALKQQPYSKFPLAAVLDGDYELELQFTRYSGDGEVAIHFPVGIHTLRLLLGVGKGESARVDFIDGVERGLQRQPGLITNNQPHRVLIRVQLHDDEASFHVDLDDIKDYLKWEGALAALEDVDGSGWRTTILQHPWIGSSENNLVFHRARVRMLSGTLIRDNITSADRERDLKDGFVRLLGEKPVAMQPNGGLFSINQLVDATKVRWPRGTPDLRISSDYYAAHAPSRLQCPIPARAKSFSVVAYNCISGTSKYQIFVDGNQVFGSAEANVIVIKVDLPDNASFLELVADPVKDNGHDHVYWCHPRFHTVPAKQVVDAKLDSTPEPLAFSITGGAPGIPMHNVPHSRSAPIEFRDAVPCYEFMFAHAPCSITYAVPEGMTRFTGIGSNRFSDSVIFEVWADGKPIHESPVAGLVSIDVKLPVGTKLLELKTNPLGDASADHSYWLYPRLHRN